MKKIKLLLTTAILLAFSSPLFAQPSSISGSKLLIRFDDAPQEITWELRGRTGNVIQTGGPFDSRFANRTIAYEFSTAFAGPLTFVIKDSAGNGLSGNGAWAINTERISRIESRPVREAVGDRIVNGNSNFGSQASVTFERGDRAGNLGALGSINFRDIFVFETPSNGFYQIRGNRFVRVNIVIQNDDDNDDGDDDSPQTIESSLNVRVFNGFRGSAIVNLLSTINDRADYRLVDLNGNTVSEGSANLTERRTNRIRIRNLRSGVHFLTVKTNNTSGEITRRFIVR